MNRRKCSCKLYPEYSPCSNWATEEHICICAVDNMVFPDMTQPYITSCKVCGKGNMDNQSVSLGEFAIAFVMGVITGVLIFICFGYLGG